ncbi:hypothetical protein DL96DRAFT_1607143 [Flagelloscypha sp. PMI_526]|nr:hypothetical protein DL96DRAFT_1607143 [Flagelloscypha sp. PMI_526]
MVLLEDLPVDLAREIIELAAASDTSRQTARSLSLVSREIQSWSDRFHFQNLVEDPSGPEEKDFLAHFVSDQPSNRLKRARLYVLRFASRRSYDHQGHIGCPNLTSLALWAVELPALFQHPNQSLPNLRRLCFSFVYGGASAISFRSPAFQNVTHMDLGAWAVEDWPTFWQAGTELMGSLTHLVLNGKSARTEERQNLISEAMSHMPPALRVLIVIVEEETLPDIVNEQYDPKVVFIVEHSSLPSGFGEIRGHVNGGDAFEMWSGEGNENLTYWSVAESVVEDRSMLKPSKG